MNRIFSVRFCQVYLDLSMKMFISSLSTLILGSFYGVLTNTGLIVSPMRVNVHEKWQRKKREREGERQREREEKRLVWFRNHLTTSSGN